MSEDDAYVSDTSDGGEDESSYKEKHPSLFGRIFSRKSKNPSGPAGLEETEVMPKKEPEGVAHVPTAMLAVEYLDEGPAMDAALKELNRDLVQMIESLSRR